MKIISWNIRQGGAKRIKDIARECLEKLPDVLVFSEYRNNDAGEELKKILKDNGYHYLHNTNLEKQKNTVLIATKIESRLDETFYKSLSEEERRRVLKISVGDIFIYGVYFPQKNEQKKIFEILLKEMSDLKENGIFIGDFNAGKHFIDETNTFFSCQKEFELLENDNFTDAWRYQYGEKKEYSWFSYKGNGFRIDHAFVSKNLLTDSKCYYIHKVRKKKLSDHSMLILKL